MGKKRSKRGEQRRKWEGEEQRQREERGRRGKKGRERPNSGGTVALILADRNFRRSDMGKSKVTRSPETYTLAHSSTCFDSLHVHICAHS